MKSAAVCCDRCPGATTADTSHFSRRRLLKAAVFLPQSGPGVAASGPAGSLGAPAAQATAPDVNTADRHVYRTATGTITDISPHFITIGDGASKRRLALTADATAWRGEPLEPSALTPGDEAVIRIVPSRSAIADRVWANIGRVCGTIVESDSDRLLVAECAMRPPKTVVISPLASVRIKVRLPNLKPGYLVDIIGVRRRGVLQGLIATSPQPPYRSDHLPPHARTGGRLPDAITGSAVWHDPADEPYGVLGVFYPAVEPGAGCAEDAAAKVAPGQAQAYRELPYLSIGSALHVKNECTNIGRTLPVTGCAPTARLFNDHCVACKTSPRGRIADLTLASFVALGGELEQGCFNATLTIGR
ncbi:MAG TPA: hypothetical protein VN695_10455 [Streptosporangiaceae bacterium]|nr:hypothetical protein [Streptosporangiaceae bacterium]